MASLFLGHRLKVLRCANNRLKGPLPAVVFQLRHLTELDARVNQLNVLSPAIGHLQDLEELRLSHNRLTGNRTAPPM